MRQFAMPTPIGDDVPFEQLHCYQWARTQARADVGISQYLDSLGFVKGTDKITEGEYRTLEYAFDFFHRYEARMQTARTFAQCFTPSGPSGFYVSQMPGHYELNPEVRETLRAAGWIYEINPETTYFQIVNSRLIAKYQRIIGSRILCNIKPE